MVHAIRNLYKEVYIVSGKASKRDKLGIFAKIENTLLDSFSLSIEATYISRSEKKFVLETLRIKIELIKQLVRTANEINILPEPQYIKWQTSLQEISKMTNGWIRYVTQNPSK